MSEPALVLYGRAYCHLCGEMIQALEPWHARYGFHLEVVDVDGDPALAERYGERVPVLMAGERELCHYHLDEAALRRYFEPA
ncbi:glutaredoxin family protein [Ectothiorhodospiraceae bacterium 2226]|nr:glutaredoxin family protein [Ectothiorhodospiraceae bacterium 2226]